MISLGKLLWFQTINFIRWSRIYLFRFMHRKKYAAAWDHLLASRGQSDYAIEVLVNHSLGRRVFSHRFKDLPDKIGKCGASIVDS